MLQAIRGRIREVARCYEAALKSDPTMRGSLNLRFAVSASGSVTRASLERGGANPTKPPSRFEACILEKARAWTFPPLEGGAAEFSYPLVFDSAGAANEPAAKAPRADAAPAMRITPKESAEMTASSGALDKEIIRRVIQRHLIEVKRRYDRGLDDRPDLAGRVMVHFIISSKGTVSRAEVERSTLDDDTVERCMVAAVKTWVFPAPEGGGRVEVSYPFVFKTVVQ